jgi:hypothetical protein
MDDIGPGDNLPWALFFCPMLRGWLVNIGMIGPELWRIIGNREADQDRRSRRKEGEMQEEIQTEVLIIGTGLAGSIAYHALRAFKPLCLDRRPEPENGTLGLHPAVMRLRDRQVADIIGAKFKQVSVSKAIFFNEVLHNQSDIRLNNLYSRKVYGALGRRSLNNLRDESRFILPEGYPAPENCIWERLLEEIRPGEAKVRYGALKERIKYKYLISTIPMKDILQYIVWPNKKYDELKGLPPFNPAPGESAFDYTPVKVLHFKLNIPSNIHQTIYFPSPDTDIYRITIQNQTVIVESTEETGDWAALVQRAFGIDSSCFDYGATKMDDWKTINIGKISPMNEDLRLRTIMWLTDEYRIFSFGRFAVWKPLRTDHLLGDIEKIRRIIAASDTEGIYKGRL